MKKLMKFEFMVKSPKVSTTKYISPEAIYKEFAHLSKIDQETVWIIGLDAQKNCILKENIYKGGINSSTCDPKLIFRHLLLAGCDIFVMIHNHPSGEFVPSIEDKKITKKIKDIGVIIGLNLIDHIIIGESGYYSFAFNGEL